MVHRPPNSYVYNIESERGAEATSLPFKLFVPEDEVQTDVFRQLKDPKNGHAALTKHLSAALTIAALPTGHKIGKPLVLKQRYSDTGDTPQDYEHVSHSLPNTSPGHLCLETHLHQWRVYAHL